MSFRNLMEACNRAFLLCLIEWKVPLMSKCKHFSSTLLWPLLACLLQLISARSIQSNFQDEYNAVLAPFSSTKRRQGLGGGGGGEGEREDIQQQQGSLWGGHLQKNQLSQKVCGQSQFYLLYIQLFPSWILLWPERLHKEPISLSYWNFIS